MIKNRLLDTLAGALTQAAPELNNLSVDEAITGGLRLERPRNPEHGDYAVNVSFLARHTKMPPPKIAEIISRHLKQDSLDVTVVGGYVNFRLTDALLAQALTTIVRNPEPGKNTSFADLRMLLEYVSANPTGPLHIGHGRWAALGDSIVRILRHCGAFVTAEFYINDAGVQMNNIAQSLYLRSRDVLMADGQLPEPLREPIGQVAVEAPYPGEYVLDLARQYLAVPGNRERLLDYWQKLVASIGPTIEPTQLMMEAPTLREMGFVPFAREKMLAEQRTLLDAMRVHFDQWTSEKEALYETGRIEETLNKLVARGYTYEADGALWFKSSEFGDEKDRVLKKSDGTYTYLMPDIAYHDEKYGRSENYNRITNIWGADHHGYIPRMRGAITALGHYPEHFEVLLGQLVNLIVEGERTRMGKRRKMLTLQDVVDEVGVDATRFWMVSKSADSALDFDVDLAASASSENPVFYVQYAHARCCSILRNAVEPAPNVDTGEMQAPYVQADELARFEQALEVQALAPLFDALTEARDKAILKTLVLQLDSFEDVVQDAARLRAPHFLTQYMMDVSASFHSFYNVCRILTPDPALTQPRLMLVVALRNTLAQALDLIGVSAPEQM